MNKSYRNGNRKLHKIHHPVIINNNDRAASNIVYSIDFENGERYIGCTTKTLTTAISKLVNASVKHHAKAYFADKLSNAINNNEKIVVTVLDECDSDELPSLKSDYIKSFMRQGIEIVNRKS